METYVQGQLCTVKLLTLLAFYMDALLASQSVFGEIKDQKSLSSVSLLMHDPLISLSEAADTPDILKVSH